MYFVKDGDTLWDIAKKYRVKTDRIISANGLDGENGIKQGEKLIIPIG